MNEKFHKVVRLKISSEVVEDITQFNVRYKWTSIINVCLYLPNS